MVLSRIWDLSDPGGRGSLDKAGMFVALKLVALVQNGRDLNLKHINDDVPPPKMVCMGDLRLFVHKYYIWIVFSVKGLSLIVDLPAICSDVK